MTKLSNHPHVVAARIQAETAILQFQLSHCTQQNISEHHIENFRTVVEQLTTKVSEDEMELVPKEWTLEHQEALFFVGRKGGGLLTSTDRTTHMKLVQWGFLARVKNQGSWYYAITPKGFHALLELGVVLE
jgi:hypothetical protein